MHYWGSKLLASQVSRQLALVGRDGSLFESIASCNQACFNTSAETLLRISMRSKVQMRASVFDVLPAWHICFACRGCVPQNKMYRWLGNLS